MKSRADSAVFRRYPRGGQRSRSRSGTNVVRCRFAPWRVRAWIALDRIPREADEPNRCARPLRSRPSTCRWRHESGLCLRGVAELGNQSRAKPKALNFRRASRRSPSRLLRERPGADSARRISPRPTSDSSAQVDLRREERFRLGDAFAAFPSSSTPSRLSCPSLSSFSRRATTTRRKV